MPIRILIATVAILALVACTSPAATSSPSPSPTAAAKIELQRAPANLGCDAMAVDYSSATIQIDAAAAPQVWAETDLGARLSVSWSPGFQGGDAADPVVRGPNGQVVARDGEVITIPQGAWPELAGYFVCPSATALYVLEQPPE